MGFEKTFEGSKKCMMRF